MYSSLRKILKTSRPQSEIGAGQHFVECDSCETEPAQYFCKSCQGHLCENCKTEHEAKRLTQGHAVVLLSKYISDPFVCKESKKGKCACTIKKSLNKEKEEIESHWVPFLEKIQMEEEMKKETLSFKTSAVKIEIEGHFNQVIEKLTNLKEETIRMFEEEEKHTSDAIDQTILELKENMYKLEERKNEINCILGGEDEDIQKNMCMKIKEEKLTPKRMSYEVVDFCPGSLEDNILHQVFGKRPAITCHDSVPNNRFVHWVSAKLDKTKIELPKMDKPKIKLPKW